MAFLTNSPSSPLELRVAARKSFSFNVRIRDQRGSVVDLTGAEFRLVVKQPPFDPTDLDDSDNLISTPAPAVAEPLDGFLRFDVQAKDLNIREDSYPMALVMTTVEGYSLLLAAGWLIVEDNPEFASVGFDYGADTELGVLGAEIALRGQRVVDVRLGSVLPPRMGLLSDDDRSRYDALKSNVKSDWKAAPGSDAEILNKPVLGSAAALNVEDLAHEVSGIPVGGLPGRVLGKLSMHDWDVGWVNPATSGGEGGNLDATGIPKDMVPVTNGANGWDWNHFDPGVFSINGKSGTVSLSADDIPDGTAKVVMTKTERTKLTGIATGAQVNVQADWAASTAATGAIKNKPTLGTAASQDATVFAPTVHTHSAEQTTGGVFDKDRVPRVSDLRGITMGTAEPSGGSDGDIYIQYTE